MRRLLLLLLAGFVIMLTCLPLSAQGATLLRQERLSEDAWLTQYSVPGQSKLVSSLKLLPGGPSAFKVVLAHDTVISEGETTSSICRRTTGCIFAMNADFYWPNGEPLGGVVANGLFLKSPSCGPRFSHSQVSMQTLAVQKCGFDWQGVLSSGNHQLPVAALNSSRIDPAGTIFTRHVGQRSPATDNDALHLIFRTPNPELVGRVGQNLFLQPVSMISGRGEIPLTEDRVIWTGEGESMALALEFWEAASASGSANLSLDLPGQWSEATGGHPILLQNGSREALDPNDSLVKERHPRSLLAWNAAGERWLVQIDGRNGRDAGMTLDEARHFLEHLGATDAINFDGGGSATSVVQGRVVNQPSDGIERKVSSAIVLVGQPLVKSPPAVQPMKINTAPTGPSAEELARQAADAQAKRQTEVMRLAAEQAAQEQRAAEERDRAAQLAQQESERLAAEQEAEGSAGEQIVAAPAVPLTTSPVRRQHYLPLYLPGENSRFSFAGLFLIMLSGLLYRMQKMAA